MWVRDQQRDEKVIAASDDIIRKVIVDTKAGKMLRNRSDFASREPNAPQLRYQRISSRQ